MFKQYVKINFPTFFIWARDIKDQLKIEYSTLRQVGLLRIFKQFFTPKAKWRKVLPLQGIMPYTVETQSLDAFKKELISKQIAFQEGGHTLYLSPSSWQKTSLKHLMKKYPDGVGLKISKRQGSDEKPLAESNKTCLSYEYLAPSQRELLLAYNLFYSMGIGPRLYDLIGLNMGSLDSHLAYIVEHIDGITPDAKSCEKFVEHLQTLQQSKLFKLINWNGYKDMDFICPDCNGNLLYDKKSKTPKYIDIQNFALDDYYSVLRKVAIEASHASHFGQKSYLMGGKYLYQEIPGLNLGAKRSPSVRFEIFKRLLNEADVTLKSKYIIDVGCNLGLMGAQYIKEGAAWLHGFDMPAVVPHTEKILLSIGCTRFSLTGLLLGSKVALIKHLPQNVRDNLEGCIISYLAIRGHIGWVEELADIPWSFMLYEGHQEEDAAASHKFIETLKQLKPCHVVSEGWIADANTTPRYVAIIKAGWK